MALRLLRFRRTLTALSSLGRSLSSTNPLTTPSFCLLPNPSVSQISSSSARIVHFRSFRSSATLSSSSTRQYKLYKEGDEIDENTILFEGCDYNHWLIVVDFPKDQPKPPAEEMVRTYERICAEGLGVSIEEAKKRIYACSTTTYEGFQVEMTEEESNKFVDLPGVVFVLPDSYIDPVNKQYGGDKYENGVITPRPPPIQYNRNRGRFRDRNYDRARHDQQGGPTQNWQGNAPFNQQGSMQGDGRNYGPPQSYPPQNYAPQPPVNNQNYAPQPPANNQNFAPQPPVNNQNYAPQPPMNNQSYAPQPPMNNQSYAPRPPMNGQNYGPGRRDPYQADRSGPPPHAYPGNFSQDGQRNYPQEQRNYQQGGRGNFAPSGQGYGQVPNPRFGQGTNTSFGQGNWQEANPAYRQGVDAGHGEGANPGSGQGLSPGYRQVPGQGANPGYEQGVGPSYGQGYSQGANPGFTQGAHGDGQRFPQSEQSAPIGSAGTGQGRF